MKITIGQLELQQFTAKDTRSLYCIRNHALVRKYMTDPTLISYHSHKQWVNNNLLDDPKLVLFLVRSQNKPVGMSLLRKAGDSTEIGVMFRDYHLHRVTTSTTAVATLYLAFCCLALKEVVSYVIPSHPIALAFNRALGGREVDSNKPGLIKFQVSQEDCLNNVNYLKMLKRMKDKMEIVGDVRSLKAILE